MSDATSRYPVEFFWSDEDKGFIALVPDLPGCSAFGETRQDAAREVDDAISSWIAAAREAGNPVPPPSVKKPIEDFSGKILLRMPRELHADLNEAAKLQGISLNSYICYLATKHHYSSNLIAKVQLVPRTVYPIAAYGIQYPARPEHSKLNYTYVREELVMVTNKDYVHA